MRLMFVWCGLLAVILGLSSAEVTLAAEAATSEAVQVDTAAQGQATPKPMPTPMPEIRTLRGMAPVSLLDSGLLDYLSPHMVHDTGIVVVWDKAGETLGIELAKICDTAKTNPENSNVKNDDSSRSGISILLAETGTIAPLGNRALASQEVMSDFLVLVGPAFDPAQTQGLELDDAMKAIARKRVPFASRGDGSAIHKREKMLWAAIDRDVRDGKNGYVEVGQGMIPTLNVAAAMQGYVLTDTPSFLLWAASSATPLTVMVKNAPQLERKWSIVALDPTKCPSLLPDLMQEDTTQLAQDIQAVSDWWQKPATQKRISDYSREDRIIFRPALSTAEPEPAPKAKKK